MDSRTRFKTLTTGRGGELRNIVQSMTNDPRDFPTKSALKAALAEVYPDNPELCEKLFGKLTELAQARATGGYDLLELRGIADELVLKVERDLAEADRLVAAEAEDEVTSDDATAMTDAAFGRDTIGAPLDWDLRSGNVTG